VEAPHAPEVSRAGEAAVLLVEDEPIVLNLCRAMLERLGHQVLTARAPEEAIGIAEKYPGDVDLLITDVIMPGMNGRQLAQKLQAFYPGIRCLFMSGYTADVIAHRGVLDEDVTFIQKPFKVNTLAEKIREALE
jgi:DNA-binding NtrC family response regulator